MTTSPRSSRLARPLLATGAALVALLLLALWSDLLDPLQRETARRTLDSSRYGSRGLTRTLATLGDLHPRPNLPDTGQSSGFVPSDLDVAFGLDQIHPRDLATTLGVDQAWLDRGTPVVSLLMDPADRAELDANTMERGRAWERPAYFSYIDNGEVVFASRVGARIHGGGGRRRGRYGYRLYFRRGYGLEGFPQDIFPTGGKLPAKRIILRKDGGPGRHHLIFHFQNAISSDIARRIGLPYVHSQPAAVFVNGEFTGVRGITERIDQHYVASHFGFSDFILARMKSMRHEKQSPVRRGSEKKFRSLRAWAISSDPLSLAEVRARVDVDNLVRWVLLVQVAAVGDPAQGTALLDELDPSARWFWVPWDLNISLGIWRRPTSRPAATISRFKPYFIRRGWRREMRGALNGRLLTSSPEFRSFFSTTFDEIWNHRLTASFQEQLILEYRRRCLEFGLDTRYLGIVRRFLRRRQAVLRRQLRRFYDFGASHHVSVDPPPEMTILVDGHAHQGTYRGEYFEGSVLRLEIPGTTDRQVGTWEIDGRGVEGRTIELDIAGPHQIRLVTNTLPADTTGS